MIILKRGRAAKNLDTVLEQIYMVQIQVGSIWIQLRQVSIVQMDELYKKDTESKLPTLFALEGRDRIVVHPLPNRNYRCIVDGTTRIQL